MMGDRREPGEVGKIQVKTGWVSLTIIWARAPGSMQLICALVVHFFIKGWNSCHWSALGLLAVACGG